MDVARVSKKLGIGPVKNDLDGLREFYQAWCLNVPFDNLHKTRKLFAQPGSDLDPLDADAFFERWLADGTGATCWQHSDAIYTASKALGFDARRGAGSMYDMGTANHGTVVVHLRDGSRWMIDNAFLSFEPLRVDPEAPSALRDSVNFAEVEIDGENTFVHGTHPPMPGLFFRLLETDVDFGYYDTQWRTLGPQGPFISGLHIRRTFLERVVTIRGATKFTVDRSGLNVEVLDAEGIRRDLVATMGISPDFVQSWAESGALDASLQPPGPTPDLPMRVAPSKRIPVSS